MATSTCMDESSVGCLVLCHSKQDMKVSTKSVTSEYVPHPYKNFSLYKEVLNISGCHSNVFSQTIIKKI